MDDEEVTRLADLVAGRVFGEIGKFIAVLEDLVRENEHLRHKIAHLELCVFGNEGEDESEDEGYYLESVPDDEPDFFDVEPEPESEEDDSEPTFD